MTNEEPTGTPLRPDTENPIDIFIHDHFAGDTDLFANALTKSTFWNTTSYVDVTSRLMFNEAMFQIDQRIENEELTQTDGEKLKEILRSDPNAVDDLAQRFIEDERVWLMINETIGNYLVELLDDDQEG